MKIGKLLATLEGEDACGEDFGNLFEFFQERFYICGLRAAAIFEQGKP